MNRLFVIEDQMHAEQIDSFSSLQLAKAEIVKLIGISFDTPPNKCPCTNWRKCERIYEIIEYDNSVVPWKEIERQEIVSISLKGVKLKNENMYKAYTIQELL